MINKKILGLIGLTARARRLSYGADMVEAQIKKRKVFLLLLAEEASDRTKDKFRKLAEEYKIPIIIEGTIEEISKAIGKENKAIIGIEEMNLSSAIQKIKNGGEAIG